MSPDLTPSSPLLSFTDSRIRYGYYEVRGVAQGAETPVSRRTGGHSMPSENLHPEAPGHFSDHTGQDDLSGRQTLH